VKHPDCDAFAFSSLHKICQIYQVNLTENYKDLDMYQLYVLEKSEDEGYHKIGRSYIKLYDELKTASEAQDFCRSLGGNLPAVKTGAMQRLLTDLAIKHELFAAFVGITDEAKEGAWTYMSDGSPVTYHHWAWNGEWYRRDLNCAYMRVDGFWKHTDCGDKLYFFCEIPMF